MINATKMGAPKAATRSKVRRRFRLFRIPGDSDVGIKKILLNSALQRASCVFVYVSYRKEVPTIDLIEALLRQGKRVCVPKLIYGQMHAVSISRVSELRTTWRGIKEPVHNQIFKKRIDCVLAPGLAFDKANQRLGHGGGYYDKYLHTYTKTHGKTPYIIGLCWRWQLVQALPVEDHDVSVDEVITL